MSNLKSIYKHKNIDDDNYTEVKIQLLGRPMNMRASQRVQSSKPSYIREILAAASDKNVISFAGGLPDQSHFPMSLLQDAFAEVSMSDAMFQYGETQGLDSLLGVLEEIYGLHSDLSGMITSGSQQALDLVARSFINPGDVVAMEAPSYLGALQVFGLVGAEIETVEQNADGPELDKLESLFKNRKPVLFYCVPDFHNPTGVCWSLDRRRSVASLCEKYGVTLLEDAPYRQLRFCDQELPLVSELCPSRAITLRSFSKAVAPGLRVAWVTAKREWISVICRLKQATDLHTGLPMQAVLQRVLRSDKFAKHLQSVCSLYARRAETFAEALAEYLPICSFSRVQGGMFLWCIFDEQIHPGINGKGKDTMMEVARRCLNRGVAIVPGDVFYVESAPVKAMRLNFSHSTPAQIELGVKRLASAIYDY